MEILFSDIVNLVQILLWPIILLVFLLIYRNSIRKFVEQLSPRIKKLSLLNVFDVELHEVPDLNTKWTGFGARAGFGPGFGPANIQQLAQRPYFDSTESSILSQLQDTSASDCAIIDLGKGEEWITSRLFILSFLLKQLRNLKCFVFVKGDETQKEIYIGNSTPEKVQDALARFFPDYATHMDSVLQAKFNTSLYMARSRISSVPTDPGSLYTIVNDFLQKIKSPVSADPSKWVQLQPGLLEYENAFWIDEYQIKRILGRELNESYVIKTTGASEEEIVRKVLVSSGEFVATVDSSYKYLALIDRRGLLEQVSKITGYSQ
jgi:hypothetical protein